MITAELRAVVFRPLDVRGRAMESPSSKTQATRPLKSFSGKIFTSVRRAGALREFSDRIGRVAVPRRIV